MRDAGGMEDEEFDEEYVGVNEGRNSERERGKAGAGRGEREPQITVLIRRCTETIEGHQILTRARLFNKN